MQCNVMPRMYVYICVDVFMYVCLFACLFVMQRAVAWFDDVMRYGVMLHDLM